MIDICEWKSDVCPSDLGGGGEVRRRGEVRGGGEGR